MHQSQSLIAAVLACAVLSPNSWACSPVMGYARPTNFELIKQADTIVLARVESFERKGKLEKGKSYGIFKFKTLETIKGNLQGSFLTEGDDDVCSWGDPNDFSFNKGDHGPCNATEYEVGHTYVLLLRNWKREWFVDGPPFTRVNVEVAGTNAPWAKAVREYVRIGSLNDYAKEKVALRDLQTLASSDTEYAAALAKDINAHFRKPTPAKSFSDLKSIYEEANDAETREWVLWACARSEKVDAKDFFRELLKSKEWKQYLYPVCSYVSGVKLAGFHEPIAAALSENSNEYQRRMLLFALKGTAGAEQQGFMQRVLESVNIEEAALLGEWFVNHPSQAAINHFTKLASKDYAEETDLSFALAAMGDTNVINWARGFAKKSGERDWVAHYVYARSPLPEADELARELIRNGDSEALVSLVQGYEDSRAKNRLDRLKEIAALKMKSQKLIYWLRRTLGNMVYKGDKEAESVLNQLPVVELKQ